MKKRIWTFWEPRKNLHGYLKLCIKTWQKFLPEYEIIVLDYSNLDNYLGKGFFHRAIRKKYYSLAKQSDAIRSAILEKFGGIWLDTDTIITSDKIREILDINSECIMFNRHLGFIVTKPHSKAMQYWSTKARKYIKKAYFYRKYKLLREICRLFDRNFVEKMPTWNFLGNGIVNEFLDNATTEEFCSLDRIKYYALPEYNKQAEENWEMVSEDPKDKFGKDRRLFRYFYLENDYTDYILEHEKGVILLHNSRVPNDVKKMNEEEFLKTDNTLSNLLKKILENDTIQTK